MNGAPTNANDIMIALINTCKPMNNEGAKKLAEMYEILIKKIREV